MQINEAMTYSLRYVEGKKNQIDDILKDIYFFSSELHSWLHKYEAIRKPDESGN